MKLNNLRTGLTFDDVLLVPQKSTVRSRHDVSLETTFSRNIELTIPISAANMDTVCESEMAVAMATFRRNWSNPPLYDHDGPS